MSEMTHDASKHVRTYVMVFVALAVLTGATVWVAGLKHTVMAGIAIALVIAVVKGSMVAGFFMHLIGEKKGIVWILMLTAAFFLVLIFLPLWTYWDQQGTHLNPSPAAAATETSAHHVP